ncbi:aldo/keto reductase [uncultured Desulfovibrio sp.]|uniref:aldo/keto reductase n=1 Tax=uncultured Desulfovibrio sp. TaxID=167968 RepID=UPI0025F70D79|nr:aldo/keto reductase [uncultured Desulfovibrio sp.]
MHDQSAQSHGKISRRAALRVAALLAAAPVALSALTTPARVRAATHPSGASGSGEYPDLPLMEQKRTLGRGAYSLEVSALGFGAMGATYNRGITPDRKSLIALLRQAAEHGITLFDTAQVYGPHTNEELVGEALAPYRGRVAISTKFGHSIINGVYQTGRLDSRPATIRRVAEASLKRLRVEAIDLFYQHRLDPAVPIEDVAGTVGDLIREGKVKRFGLCEVGPETIRRAHAEQPVTALQSEYHLMWRAPEKDIFPLLAELGIGFVPYSPLNRGFLGGDMTAYTRFASGNDNRATLPRFQPEALGKNLLFVEALHTFGRSRGMTAAQVALAWLLQRGDGIVPIPGTTKLAHLEENIRAARLTARPDEWRQLEATLAAVPVVGDRYPADQQKQVQTR